AEIARDAEPAATTFGIHPALFDAALHPAADRMISEQSTPGQVRLPFAWGGVSVLSRGARVLRVALTPNSSGGLRIDAVDESGTAVLRVDSLDVRPVDTT